MTTVVHDTRAVVPGALFCCVPGAHVDGHDLAADAVARGAAVLLVERPLGLGVPEVRRGIRAGGAGPGGGRLLGPPLGRDARGRCHGHERQDDHDPPARRRSWRPMGGPTATIGTLSGPRTTPEAPELQALPRGRAGSRAPGDRHGGVLPRAGARARASHPLRRRSVHQPVPRPPRLPPRPRATTSKRRRPCSPRLTPTLRWSTSTTRAARCCAARALVPTEGYSLRDASTTSRSPRRAARFRWRGVARSSYRWVGGFNVSNALAAATAAARLGVPADTIAAGLAGAPSGARDGSSRSTRDSRSRSSSTTPTSRERWRARSRRPARPPPAGG